MATNMPATQVSLFAGYYGTYPASNAVDGSRKTAMADLSCVHSLNETNPWLTVDLGIPLAITGVFLTNRDGAGM